MSTLFVNNLAAPAANAALATRPDPTRRTRSQNALLSPERRTHVAVAALRHAAARLAAVARAVTKAAPTAASGAQRGARRPARPPEVRARAPTTDPHPNAFDRPPIAPHQPPNDSAAPSRRPTTCAHVAPAGRHIGADRPFHAAAHARRVAPSFDRSYVASALPRCRIPRGRYFSTVTFSVSVTFQGYRVQPSRHTRKTSR